MSSGNISDDQLFLFWEHILKHSPSDTCIRQLCREVPRPESSVLKRLLVLRSLEIDHSRRRFTIKSYNELCSLKELCDTKADPEFAVFLKEESFPDSEKLEYDTIWQKALLAVARELVLSYMRVDDHTTYPEVKARYWDTLGAVVALDPPRVREFREFESDIGFVKENYGKQDVVLRKYPLGQTMVLFENLIALEWKRSGDSFLKRIGRDIVKGFYSPYSAFNVMRKRGGSEDADFHLRELGEFPPQDLNPKLVKPVLGETVIAPRKPAKTQTPITSPCAILRREVQESAAEETHQGFPGSPIVLNERVGQEETPRPQVSVRSELLPSKKDTILKGLSRVPAPPWADVANQERDQVTDSNNRKRKSNISQKSGRKMPSELDGGSNEQTLEASLEGDDARTPSALLNLRTSSAKLRDKGGDDPLPHARAVGGRVLSALEQTRKAEPESLRGTRIGPSDSSNEAGPSQSTAAPSAFSNGNLVHPLDKNESDAEPATGFRKPNITFDRKASARQEHWDDSDGEVEIKEDRRPRFQVSPVRTYSPLQKGQSPENAANKRSPSQLRRKTKPWSVREIKCLASGVQLYGRRWRMIRNNFPDVFSVRTHVDLKDKWRNLALRPAPEVEGFL